MRETDIRQKLADLEGKVESLRRSSPKGPVRPPIPMIRDSIFPAKITGGSTAAGWEWDEVYVEGDGTNTSAGRTHTTCAKLREVNGLPLAVNTIVYIHERMDTDAGNLVWATAATSQLIIVTCEKTGGDAGSFDTSTDCSFVYTVKDDPGNITLATNAAPLRARIPACEYTVAASCKGLAKWDGAALTLLDVFGERVASKTVTAFTAWQFDTTTGKFQCKTTDSLVLDKKTESDWTDLTASFHDCTP